MDNRDKDTEEYEEGFCVAFSMLCRPEFWKSFGNWCTKLGSNSTSSSANKPCCVRFFAIYCPCCTGDCTMENEDLFLRKTESLQTIKEETEQEPKTKASSGLHF